MLRVGSGLGRMLLVGLLAIQGAIAAQSQGSSNAKVGSAVAQEISAHGSASVVVALRPSAQLAGESRVQRLARIANDSDTVLAHLPAGSFAIRHRFANVEAIALQVSAQALPALEQNDAVLRIDVDVGGGANMLEAAQVSGIAQLRAAGYTGKGVKVAIIDSGAQLDHPDLADSIADQYCYCSSATPGIGCCPDGSDVQGGAGSALDQNGHGTNVTGIVTGNGNYAPEGGAPDASVVLVRVLDAQGHFSNSSDIVAALDWVATNHPDVKVVNLSLGTSSLFTDACDNVSSWSMALKQAVDAVIANGGIVTASTGNAGSPNSIAAPACISGVVAVGAVWDSTMADQTFLGCTDTGIVAGKATCFTNSNPLVSLYAPGAYTTATGSNIDPYTAGYSSTYGGTSQAAPLVAACIADLYQQQPSLTPDQMISLLVNSSAHVTDPKNGLTFPMLDCGQSTAVADTVFDAGFEHS